MAMTTVVYADILFIVNAYITDLLLLLCDCLCREKSKRGRRAVSSLLGGLYAFIIFVPALPRSLLVLSRLPAAAVLLLAAYGLVGRGRFVRLYLGFFLINFVFAGLMGALWHTLHPKRMLYYGTVVYFGMDARMLILLTTVCYGLLWAADRLMTTRRARESIYELRVTFGGKNITCRAFLDTGNALREPFSGDPVVLLHQSAAQTLGVPAQPDPQQAADCTWRLIPCETVHGSGVLYAFRPASVCIRSLRGEWETDRVFVAVTTQTLQNNEFGALLHPALLELPLKKQRNTEGEERTEYETKVD